MIQKRLSKKFLSLSLKLVLIVTLWIGGVYAFQGINKITHSDSVATQVDADGAINVWWPTNGAKIGDLQTFKAQVQDKNVTDYAMYWQVDGGQMNEMYDSSTDYPHKEAAVDLKGWTWKGSGPYTITFKAVDKNNNSLGETSITIQTPDAPQGPTKIQTALQEVAGLKVAAADISSQPTVSAPTLTSLKWEAPAQNLSVWWPTNNTVVQGTQSLKAVLQNNALDAYKMYWSVDGGELHEMNNAGDHKEADVDFSGWKWKGNGPYKLTFTAKNNSGVVSATSDVNILTGAPATTQTQVTQAQTQTQVQTEVKAAVQNMSQPVAGNPLSGQKIYNDPNNDAARVINDWKNSRPDDANQLQKIATQPGVTWLGGWNSDISGDVKNTVNNAKAQGAMPVFVAYNIPNRDCGQYSAGGVGSAGEYHSWIQKIADAIGGSKAAMIIEPDALTLTDCLGGNVQSRYDMIKDAVATFKAKGNIAVYLDAGHPEWISADDMANRLKQAGVAQADGFALNTSNFFTTQDNLTYGTAISQKTGGKHFVIDTGRNGVGPTVDRQWCNPWGRALGNKPTTNTGNSLVDAYLWVKGPGGSDGNCNGGPNAGAWWPDYALDLAKHSAF